jgi:hypothetical protein
LLTLVRYLNTLTAKEPLLSRDISEVISCSLSSTTIIQVIRSQFLLLYPGRYRCVLVLTEFLKPVRSVTPKRLFRLFATAFFGNPVVARFGPNLTVLFEMLIERREQVFLESTLADGAYMTDHQNAALKDNEAGQRRRESTMRTVKLVDVRQSSTGTTLVLPKGAPRPVKTTSTPVQCNLLRMVTKETQCRLGEGDLASVRPKFGPVAADSMTFSHASTSNDEERRERKRPPNTEPHHSHHPRKKN